MTYSEAAPISSLLETAQTIAIIQADNPDADSLGSALALEHILGDMDKTPLLYCAVDIPGYLRYMKGWDRLQTDLPSLFDASIIVDASTLTLFERLGQSGQQSWLASKPCIVLDHHATVDNIIPFANVMLNDSSRASTGELIYLLAQQLQWPLSLAAQEFLMTSILGDTQGLSNQLASAETYRIMANFVESGVDRPKLEELRRDYGKMAPQIYKYKALLIQRTEFSAEGRIASVVIPQQELHEFSPLYNPAPLIQGDMLQTSGVLLSIVFKNYEGDRITAAIRCNPTAGIGAQLAEHFGGGGHAFASGFKITSGRSLDSVKTDCLQYAQELLAQLSRN